MRIMATSHAAFQGWLPGRVLLPVGFAALVGIGAYVVADGHGYERGLAEHMPVTEVARIAEEPSEVLLNEAEAQWKADREGIPGLLRAIDPTAVYQPSAPQKPVVAIVKSPVAKPGHARHVDQTASALPAGVERFDRCEGACDTRDPMIVQASYTITEPAQPAPKSQPSAPAVAAASESFSLPSAGDIVDRTVEGTQSAYGAVRDGAAAAVNSVKRTLSGALDLIR
ncbi:MAG: hypothetical protein DI549_06325 [Ancylobacter novellus]|uniref:Uncharacterized protein n=1 Tax=Ancylobacter novellus TaxID=921 RepID=A0A2W5R4K0_ANCNO|nr:MAG: hypothetical protein DI549_06325 [Ancylobacter novellus]